MKGKSNQHRFCPADANIYIQSRRHDQAWTRKRQRRGRKGNQRGCRHLERCSGRSKTPRDQGGEGPDGAGEGCPRKHGNFGGQTDGLSWMIGHAVAVGVEQWMPSIRILCEEISHINTCRAPWPFIATSVSSARHLVPLSCSTPYPSAISPLILLSTVTFTLISRTTRSRSNQIAFRALDVTTFVPSHLHVARRIEYARAGFSCTKFPISSVLSQGGKYLLLLLYMSARSSCKKYDMESRDSVCLLPLLIITGKCNEGRRIMCLVLSLSSLSHSPLFFLSSPK